MTEGRHTIAILAGLLLAILTGGPTCSEALPPYIDPTDVFDGSIEGAYVLIPSDNSVKIYLKARNRYDETLEGPAVLQGEAEISLARDPSMVRKFTITSANLLTSRNYNPSTGVLRVDPGETMVFGLSWNLVTDNGTNLRGSHFRYWVDLECPMRCVAEAELFIIRGSVIIFDKTGTVTPQPASFSLCHVNAYIEPRLCPPIDYTIPCSKRAITNDPESRRCP